MYVYVFVCGSDGTREQLAETFGSIGSRALLHTVVASLLLAYRAALISGSKNFKVIRADLAVAANRLSISTHRANMRADRNELDRESVIINADRECVWSQAKAEDRLN